MKVFFFVLFLVGLLALIVRNRVKIGRFLGKWNEFITIPVAIIMWVASSDLLRLLDPTAGTFDAGIFQIILFALIEALFYHGFVCLIMRLRWPVLDTHLAKDFSSDFKQLTPWQKIKLSTSVFFLLFFGLALLALAI